MNEVSNTKTRILDVAEKLFGEKGFDSTSLRDITAEAQVNLAAVNYHFQSKESLIEAVIERRIEPINRRRMEMLDAAGPNPTLEQVIEAFVGPALEREMLTPGPLIGRILSTPDQFANWVYKKHLAGMAERFSAAIGQALPGLPAEESRWRLHFMAGSMAHVLVYSSLLPMMTNGLCTLTDRKAVIARLVAFQAAGFRAPVATASMVETH